MRAPSLPVPSSASDWRAFAARQYRPFRILAIAQGFIGALTGPAITIPLLLALGAHPALATAVAVLPALGTMSQRWLPAMLDRTDGNLRGIVILFATIGEPRGFLLAGAVAMTALGGCRRGQPSRSSASSADCSARIGSDRLQPAAIVVPDHPAR